MASSDRDRTTVAAIKKLILDRRLTPGDPMPTESDLMDTLDVSRSSVREAVRTLVALDILQVRHGTGTFVGGMSLRPLVEAMVFRGILSPGDSFDSLREVVEVRMGLDFALAPRVVESLSGTDGGRLHAYVAGMEASAARNERFLADDRAFHLDLAGRLDNRLYAELVAAFWDIHKSTAPSLGMVNRRDLAETAAAHGAMLRTAQAGDLDGYRAAITDHYAPLLRVLADQAQQQAS